MAKPPITQSKYEYAVIQRGIIVDVNVENFTVCVYCEASKEYHQDCPIACEYIHPAGGEGIFVMPETRSHCWLCHPSDSSRLPFVLAFAPPEDYKGTNRANRIKLNPGDIYLGGRDGNRIIMRRGGILEIGGGQMPKTVYIPVLNTIREFSENYEMYLIGGTWKWVVRSSELSSDASSPVLSSREIRRKASDKLATVELKEGQVSGEVVLETAVYDVTSNTARTQTILMQGDKAGNLTWTCQEGIALVSKTKNIKLQTLQQDIELISGRDLSTQAVQDIKLAAGRSTSLSAGTGSLTLTCSQGSLSLSQGGAVQLLGNTVILGGTGGLYLVDERFITAFTGHTHAVAGPTTLVPDGNSIAAAQLAHTTLTKGA